MPNLFLVFNHQFTEAQEIDARKTLGVNEITDLPLDLRKLWSHIPPDIPEIVDYLKPIHSWLGLHAQKGDFILIQGDFGASYLTVEFSFKKGWIPIYSTTEREALEEIEANGSVKLTHYFRHRIFRKYGR